MIKVNLLPEGVRPSMSASLVLALPWRQITIAGVGLIIVYSGWLLLANQLEKSSLARFTTEWEALQPERTQLSQTKATLYALQNRVAVLTALKAAEGRWAPRLNILSDSIVSNLWFMHLMYVASPKGEAMTFVANEFKDLGLPEFQLPEEDLAEGESGEEPQLGASEESVTPAPFKPRLYVKGMALVTAGDKMAPVSRFLQRLKEHPNFSRWFDKLELKDVDHIRVKSDEVSEFLIVLYPMGL